MDKNQERELPAEKSEPPTQPALSAEEIERNRAIVLARMGGDLDDECVTNPNLLSR